MNRKDTGSELRTNHTVRLDEIKRYGVELYFRPHRYSPKDIILIGAGFLRKGLLDSKGFDGELPYGLRFEDRLETVMYKIDRHPDAERADALNGYYIWKLPEFLLHVEFSVRE